MKHVFDRIFNTRPSTFTIFKPSSIVEMGISPMASSATGVSFVTDKAILPAKTSTCIQGSGSLTYSGRICNSPWAGGSFSLEFIRSPNRNHNELFTETVATVTGLLTLTLTGDALGTRYSLNVLGNTSLVEIEISTASGPDHVVINMQGDTFGLIVNGDSRLAEIDEELSTPFTAANSASIFPSTNGLLWGSVLRGTSVEWEYCKEVSDLVKDFPLPSEADALFNSQTFVFTRDRMNTLNNYNLEDIEFPDFPDSDNMINGGVLSDPEWESITGAFLIGDDAVDVSGFMAVDRGLNPTIIGGLSLDNTDPLLFSKDIYNTSLIEPWDQSSNGEPEFVYLSNPSLTTYETPVSLDIRMLPAEPTMNSDNAPDRVAKFVIGSSGIVGLKDAGLLEGGAYSTIPTGISIQADAEAELPENYPEAYGMWIFMSRQSATLRTLFSSTGMSLSLSTTHTLTKTGLGNVYVDGVLYSSGALTTGWHFISFIPTTKANNTIYLGGSADVLIYSFAMYYLESPSGYMNTLYRMHVDPPEVRPATSDTISVSEGATKVYTHDWSISSAD